MHHKTQPLVRLLLLLVVVGDLVTQHRVLVTPAVRGVAVPLVAVILDLRLAARQRLVKGIRAGPGRVPRRNTRQAVVVAT